MAVLFLRLSDLSCLGRKCGSSESFAQKQCLEVVSEELALWQGLGVVGGRIP